MTDISKTTKHIENRLREERLKNILEVQKNPTFVSEKIENYIERFGGIFTFDEVVDKIKNDQLVASMFCKDPAKQNFTEEWVADIIKLNKNVIDFKILPKGGSKSIRIGLDGNLIYGGKVKVVESSKSVDYIFKNKKDMDKTYVCTQKFTRGRGGAQDNQLKDVTEFLKFGSRVLTDKLIFVAILDGDYFCESKMNELRAIFSQYNNIKICSADAFAYKYI